MALSYDLPRLILERVNSSDGFSNWLEIDRDAIANNVRQVGKITGVQVMAVIKANGYGHGILESARISAHAGARYCGVARVEEAFELRRSDFNEPILVLGNTPAEKMEEAIGRRTSITIFKPQHVEAVSAAADRAGRHAIVHVKVDTGMSRLGASPETAFDILRRLSECPSVDVEGIFTHYARADEPDDPTTARQEAIFLDLLGEVESSGLRPPLVHASNSAAMLSRPSSHFDMVRPGIAVFGLNPAPDLVVPDRFRIALEWKARLSYIHRLPPGTGVSYGHHYITAKEETIGVVPVGYGDGYRRVPGNEVLIHGKRVPVVGRVCMDQLMVLLDDVPKAQVGDEVILIGAQDGDRITAEELASRWGTFNYEVVCGLSARVPRAYL
jgi:alanine racemase